MAIDEIVVADARQGSACQFLERGERLGALNRDLRVAVAGEIHLGSPAVGVADMLVVLLLVRGVHAQEKAILGDAVHQDIVHEAAVIVEQAGVLDLARGELGGRVRAYEIDQG